MRVAGTVRIARIDQGRAEVVGDGKLVVRLAQQERAGVGGERIVDALDDDGTVDIGLEKGG